MIRVDLTDEYIDVANKQSLSISQIKFYSDNYRTSLPEYNLMSPLYTEKSKNRVQNHLFVFDEWLNKSNSSRVFLEYDKDVEKNKTLLFWGFIYFRQCC